MARIAAGEHGEPLEQLIGRYSRPLYGLGMRLLGDRGLAEDLVQDSFVRVWRSAERFDPDRGSVRTFVYTLAHRAATDLQRRTSRAPVPVDDAEGRPITEAPPADRFDQILTSIEVRDSIESLSDAHRQVIELSYDEGLSQRQIAERIGVPVGTVKTRCYHALRALRADLEGRGIDA